MPRYRGVGMPKAKKRKIEQSHECVEEPTAPPPAPDPDPPSTPEHTQVNRGRRQQSPGMKAVKAAEYVARKAKRVAGRAHNLFLKAQIAEHHHYVQIMARMDGIMRSWKKTGNKKAFSHLERWHRAELELKTKHVSTLEDQVVALSLAGDAKDAEIDAQKARIARLSRLLRVRKNR